MRGMHEYPHMHTKNGECILLFTRNKTTSYVSSCYNSPEVHGGYASLGNTTAFATDTENGPSNEHHPDLASLDSDREDCLPNADAGAEPKQDPLRPKSVDE